MADPNSLSLTVRQQNLTALKSYSALSALVPASRIYPEQPPSEPARPFIRYGLPVMLSYEQQGRAGSNERVSIHAFTQSEGTDELQAIVRQVIACMNSYETSDPPPFNVIEWEWIGVTILRDSADATDYHAVIEFRVTVTAIS